MVFGRPVSGILILHEQLRVSRLTTIEDEKVSSISTRQL